MPKARPSPKASHPFSPRAFASRGLSWRDKTIVSQPQDAAFQWKDWVLVVLFWVWAISLLLNLALGLLVLLHRLPQDGIPWWIWGGFQEVCISGLILLLVAGHTWFATDRWFYGWLLGVVGCCIVGTCLFDVLFLLHAQ